MGEVLKFPPRGAFELQRRIHIGNELAQIAIQISVLEDRRAELEKELDNGE